MSPYLNTNFDPHVCGLLLNRPLENAEDFAFLREYFEENKKRFNEMKELINVPQKVLSKLLCCKMTIHIHFHVQYQTIALLMAFAIQNCFFMRRGFGWG